MYWSRIRNFCFKIDFFYAGFASFLIAAGWSWYHFNKHPKWVFFGKTLALYAVVVLGFYLLRAAYVYLVKLSKRHDFWSTDFLRYFNELYLIGSLFFLVFFIRIEWLSLVYFGGLLLVLFFEVQKILKKHPDAEKWVGANNYFFYFGFLIFCLQSVLQYAAYHYYILDSNIRFYNIVLFRSVAMTFFWLFCLALAAVFYWKIKSFTRYIGFTLWFVLFTIFIVIWGINLGILYYSGLYFSPVVLQHTEGSAGIVTSLPSVILILSIITILVTSLIFFVKRIRLLQRIGERHSIIYSTALSIVAIMVFVGVASFHNTPEHAIALSFYDYYYGKLPEVKLSQNLQKKLLKFGLAYQPDEFHVNTRSEIFTPTTTKFLPERLLKNKPNILIVELESFSSRLTDTYNSKYPGVTPHLKEFSDDPHTTIFKKYYNASTPTITGTLSQLCSFLPPTGHEEIQNERKLQSHHLLCLPEVLRKDDGYKYAAYVTAVDKEFAHKDGIFTSAGVDKIFGTTELKKYVSGEPLSWGYSDHQLFPVVFEMMKNAPQPFLMMYATVDTHPPFDLAKDAVNYEDGKRPVLNMFHTTDDAFGKFWQQFKSSDLYNNTIVIAVADHAIFPGALTTDLFPEDAKTLSYYDQNFFAMYVPDSVLKKEYDVYSSAIDLTPTVLQMLNVNIPNSFEGHSIFDDRVLYPNLLGMHELGLYINQVSDKGKRSVLYNVPTEIKCNAESDTSTQLSLCEYKEFYNWKRQMFEEGRFWKL